MKIRGDEPYLALSVYEKCMKYMKDGLIGIELPVSMYTTQTPIDMCRFNVRSSTLKNVNIFYKRHIN
jgi:hypothetical protein